MPLIIILFGIFLMALSGVEKIIIYLNFAEKAGRNMDTLLILVPSYIWSITNYTLIGGLLLIGFSAIIILSKKYPPKTNK
ncbi:hypothetical protein [Paenibacillus apiarius]|uniref:Uncharacterized protein n=1 Tax=Paenibacillus apiarius TaxID=46240 RepID=A0ABT4DWD9_9BACL|nr:hypothetical protein [Paenibacillus apiarius]MCY9517671.1 hypothetical protein [Paenibacillus apiarius]MCY9521676.1 hypothetical protein [Paenibacillus apiarius]MCY9555354.1 hypothetical protein [Paenibacillus apiarius]MCY9561234.1 hypothetical protein [Paenibacillus apiarius]MCY9686377.1 hypothetical protein [Paenibacillus apiarius]